MTIKDYKKAANILKVYRNDIKNEQSKRAIKLVIKAICEVTVFMLKLEAVTNELNHMLEFLTQSMGYYPKPITDPKYLIDKL